MGTLCRIAWAGECPDLEEAVRERADRLESLMTRFREDSEISGLTDQWQKVSPDTAAVLGAAKFYEHQTSGWFCALVGAQMRVWDRRVAVYADGGEAASVAEWGGARAVPLMEQSNGGGTTQPNGALATAEHGAHGARGRIELDGHWCRVNGAPARAVDLGGIAKGYAADQLRDVALRAGASDVLVTLGTSSISVAGAPATIGIASPWAGWDRIGSLTLESGALAVSADPGTAIGTRRGHSHVLDPQTGQPAPTDLCGAVVCGRDGMACEAFSTAYLAMGLDAAVALDTQHPEVDSIFMTIDGRLLASPNLNVRTAPGFNAWLAEKRRYRR